MEEGEQLPNGGNPARPDQPANPFLLAKAEFLSRAVERTMLQIPHWYYVLHATANQLLFGH